MSFKILFMGTPEFAVPALEAIFKSHHKVLEVYTQPPKKKDRGQRIQNSAIHNFANSLGIKVRFPTSLDEKKEIDHIKKLKPDIVIVVAYGVILPTNLLNLENILFINIHASLLPRWRGAAPIQRAIMNMDKKTGISIMKIIPKLDAGPILIQSEVIIDKEANQKELNNKMSKLGAKLILNALELIEKDKASFTEQNNSEATYAKKITKIESKIDWNLDAKKIIAKINAFHPNPGCWFDFFGKRIKVIKAKEIITTGKPGEILDQRFTIGCSKNAIQILELKKEGKQNISAEEFLKGNKIKIGENLENNV